MAASACESTLDIDLHTTINFNQALAVPPFSTLGLPAGVGVHATLEDPFSYVGIPPANPRQQQDLRLTVSIPSRQICIEECQKNGCEIRRITSVQYASVPPTTGSGTVREPACRCVSSNPYLVQVDGIVPVPDEEDAEECGAGLAPVQPVPGGIGGVVAPLAVVIG